MESEAAAHCGHVMRIPQVAAVPTASPLAEERAMAGPTANADAVAAAPEAAQSPAFKLSPAELRPWIERQLPLAGAAKLPAAPPVSLERQPAPHDSVFPLDDFSLRDNLEKEEFPSRFELLDEDDPPAVVSLEVERGLREMAEFQRDPRGYEVHSTPAGFCRGLIAHGRPVGSTSSGEERSARF